MRYKVTTKPLLEPVSLDELKDHLRITSTQEDSYLTNLITSGRQMIEDYTRRKLIEQTVTLYLDGWPSKYSDVWWDGTVQASRDTLSTYQSIQIPLVPLIDVSEVSLFSTDNTESTYSASNYYVNNFDNDTFGSIELNQGSVITGNLRRKNSIKVTYTVGYGPSPSDVPYSLRQSCLVMSAYLYNNRGDCDGGGCVDKAGLGGTLSMYKVQTIG